MQSNPLLSGSVAIAYRLFRGSSALLAAQHSGKGKQTPREMRKLGGKFQRVWEKHTTTCVRCIFNIRFISWKPTVRKLFSVPICHLAASLYIFVVWMSGLDWFRRGTPKKNPPTRPVGTRGDQRKQCTGLGKDRPPFLDPNQVALAFGRFSRVFF